MKYLFFIAGMLCMAGLFSQVPYNPAVPNGNSKKAMIAEQVGLTQVSISYHRPQVNGREGKIWGGLVHQGFKDQGFGNRKPAPWRAGANENTVIEFDDDVKVEGQALAKGKYALFIAYDPVSCTLIFSRRTDAWGSFFYEEAEDALRVNVTPRPLHESVNLLKFEFSDQTTNGAVVSLCWEKLGIPFRIETDYLRRQFEALLAQSQQPGGFTAQGLNLAANWALQNNYQLTKALEWASLATGPGFPGDAAYYPAHITKAGILQKLNKTAESDAALRSSLPVANMSQLQQLGRQLIADKRTAIAMEVFEFNYNKNKGAFVPLTGMARGLSAKGDYSGALAFARHALAVAPNEAARQAVQAMIDKLAKGQDIN